MRILVLGAAGMLGNAVFRVLSQNPNYEVWGSARSDSFKKHLSKDLSLKIISGVDVENTDSLTNLFISIKPSIVINCIGLVKQLISVNDPLCALPINSLLPHRLSRMCELAGSRLIHVSTDCVFSGKRGQYVESDDPDAQDLYGRSKLLGEVEYPNTITLRTSIIGHEYNSNNGLIEWFLAQENSVRGYTRAIFSGLTTYELAKLIEKFVISNPSLTGLFHIASDPICKYDLLKLVNQIYVKNLTIEPDDTVRIDRSLNASKFYESTGYVAPSWYELVSQMRSFH